MYQSLCHIPCIFLHIALVFCTAPFLCEANWNLPQVTSSAISPREERKENEICGIGYINFVLSWSFKKSNNKERSLEKIGLFNLFEEWKLTLLFNILICFRVIFTQLPFLRIFVNLWFDLEYNLDLFTFYRNLVKKSAYLDVLYYSMIISLSFNILLGGHLCDKNKGWPEMPNLCAPYFFFFFFFVNLTCIKV